MLGIATLGDIETCPACKPFTPVPIVVVPTFRTFVNGRPVATVGSVLSNCGAVAITGSLTVYVENKPVHRRFDLNSCGGQAITASLDTYCGL